MIYFMVLIAHCIHTCVQEGHQHQDCCKEVDRLGPEHLTTDSVRPVPELLESVVSVIPVPVGTGKVKVLQCVENLVGFVLLLSKVLGDAAFHNNYSYELEHGEYNQSNEGLLQIEEGVLIVIWGGSVCPPM